MLDGVTVAVGDVTSSLKVTETDVGLLAALNGPAVLGDDDTNVGAAEATPVIGPASTPATTAAGTRTDRRDGRTRSPNKTSRCWARCAGRAENARES
jgi:hypothetical protein